uniref:C2H2-type domain-containing protein n=1 Tax=Bracon brevicornis TaxID=1563983 RepID=A0A6V7JPM3_9HYME
MDLAETYPAGGGHEDELSKTDFFDFVVSPTTHCTTTTGGVSDEDSYLHRTTCRGLTYLQESRHDDHDTSAGSFIKETNNNTLTALPPVSTITGSLSHHNVRNHCVSHDQVPMDQSDCDYWATDDSKEQTCNILLEDLNKFCWSTTPTSHDVHNDVTHRVSSANDRQNTDGAIYTLTVLNNEANSMDGLDCCKSPTAPSSDSWSLRPNLDLDAILSLEPSPNDQDHDVQSSADHSRNVERYHVIATPSSQYTDDSGFVESKELCRQTNPSGDNNNDWKLSDQNQLQEVVAAAAAAGDNAESLLRSALQGKLYGTAQIVSPSSSQASTISLSVTSNSSGGLQIMEHQQSQQPQQNSQEHSQSEPMTCTDDDLLLSHLTNQTSYRPGEYEKLKSIENEVVESYVSVGNVSTPQTVLYTLDPASGSLGTITLPADIGTVTVVAAQPDLITQTSGIKIEEPPPQNPPIQIARARSSTKVQKKYCRRSKNNNANNSNGTAGTGNGGNAGQPGSGSRSPNSVQRKERSLHYCSICSKGFKDKYSVNVHIRTHTGEKPFACSLCGKSFRQKAHLAKHYQTHVAQKPGGSSNSNSNSSNNSNASPSDSARGNHTADCPPSS